MGTVRSTSIEFGCPNYDGVRTSVPRPMRQGEIIDKVLLVITPFYLPSRCCILGSLDQLHHQHYYCYGLSGVGSFGILVCRSKDTLNYVRVRMVEA